MNMLIKVANILIDFPKSFLNLID